MNDRPKIDRSIFDAEFQKAFDDAVMYGCGMVEVRAVPHKLAFGQSRKHSLFESITNVVVGFSISVLANWIVMPWFGLSTTWAQASGIGAVLTVVSIVRSYWLRRLYNWIHVRGV